MAFGANLCFLLHMFYLFFYSNGEISEMRRPIGAKFCTVMRPRLDFVMPVQNFGGPLPPKKK